MARLLLIADDDWVTHHVEAAIRMDDELFADRDPESVEESVTDLHPDAVLIDLQVGAMGGMAIVRALKDHMAGGHIPRLPLILLLDREADRFLARRAGADAALVKPFEPAELHDALDRLVPAGA